MSSLFVAVQDLFFAERLGSALRALGHQAQVIDLSLEAAPVFPAAGVALAIVDLEAGEPGLAVVRQAKAAGVPVLAFGPHTDLALRQGALAAGATRVVAKSKLTSSLGELVGDLLQH